MLHKFFLTAKPWQSILFKILSYIILSVMTLIFLLCIAAFMIVRIDTPEYVLIPLTTILLTASSFIDSFILSKIFKENGLLIGVSIGTVFVVITVFLSFFYNTFSFTALFFSKAAAVLIAGMLGGILGVNT